MANQTIYPYGTGGSLPASVGIINDLITGGSDKALSAEMGKYLGNLVGENSIPETGLAGLPHYKDGNQIDARTDVIGSSLDSCATYSDSGCKNARISLVGYDYVSVHQYGTGYGYGTLFVDDQDIVVGVLTSASSGARYSVKIPNGAAYMIYSYYPAAAADKTIYLYTADSILQRLSALELGGSSEEATGKCPTLTRGKLNSSGSIVDGNFVTTDTIFGDFSIVLAEGWRVYEGHLYDRSGKMVAYQHIHPDVSHTGARGSWSNRTFLGIANSVPDYGYRLTLCKADSSAIADDENPVDNFVLLANSGLHRWIPEDLPNYERALRRVDYLESLRWIPLSKVPNGYSESGQPRNAADIYFCLAGQLASGVPYSDVADTRTYVPNNVSVRTFMTALKNKRSLIYTEELGNNTSKYGMSYTTGHRRAYYGNVCCGFTAWVMGMDTMFLAGQYGADGVPGLSAVTYNSVNDLRPLDLVWQEGHIAIISDIWKDEFNNVKYITLAEMSTPYPYRTLYTAEQFDARRIAVSATVHRWTGWDELPEPPETVYGQYHLGDTRKDPKVNEDIMTFAGDYAAFVEGDTIYLNARRNSTYTGIELYKDNILIQTIDITGLSADTIVTPNTEDWVAVNLTTLNLTHGKYKARMTDGTNVTDYTYFEIIGITMTATKSGNNVIVDFSANGGVPVSIEQVKQNGFPASPNGKLHKITSEEVTAGTMTLSWAYNSTYKYLLMLVRGDYGTVAKRISHPSA